MAEPRILIVFHTSEGQTRRIADRIAEVLRDDGATVDVVDVDDAPDSFDGYDGVALGDPIHVAHHSRPIARYAKDHADELEALPSAFFQVSLTSAVHDEEHDREAHEFVTHFVEDTGWNPDLVGLFGGRLAYTRYGFMKRRMMKMIAKSDPGLDTDTSHDTEYTDWDEVEHFARDLLAHVRAQQASG